MFSSNNKCVEKWKKTMQKYMKYSLLSGIPYSLKNRYFLPSGIPFSPKNEYSLLSRIPYSPRNELFLLSRIPYPSENEIFPLSRIHYSYTNKYSLFREPPYLRGMNKLTYPFFSQLGKFNPVSQTVTIDQIYFFRQSGKNHAHVAERSHNPLLLKTRLFPLVLQPLCSHSRFPTFTLDSTPHLSSSRYRHNTVLYSIKTIAHTNFPIIPSTSSY